jgi:hypothetical protein
VYFKLEKWFVRAKKIVKKGDYTKSLSIFAQILIIMTYEKTNNYCCRSGRVDLSDCDGCICEEEKKGA